MDLIKNVKSRNWEKESHPQYQDFFLIPLFALFFFSVRFFLDRFVFESLGRRLIFGRWRNVGALENEDTRKRIRKFKESAWKCIYYLSAEVLALYVTYDEPWFTNTRNFWVGAFHEFHLNLVLFSSCQHPLALRLSTYIKYKEGAYVVTQVYCLLSHDGEVVLAIHDASDVFLEVGKMSKYSGAEVVASSAFILFVLSWIILRLIYYPFWILWSTSYEVLLTLDKEKHPVEGPIYYYVFNTLLYCLLVLHIYWWVLMYRMLVKQIQARGQLSDDVRSGDATENPGLEDPDPHAATAAVAVDFTENGSHGKAVGIFWVTSAMNNFQTYPQDCVCKW
ncbi:hypothetical protein F8388_024424 [Cannabis sativa]|uniref:TLC domain-containing protein n=1 Tax=Cannabis sativa TaxID=3483 RepID=A0A7J6EH82_CANSA|nr:hypothetical protein F8388_024424 [Cannabis sativa]